MPKVNIGPGQVVEMTDEEARVYAWGRGPLPVRLAKPEERKLANGKPVTNSYEAYWALQPPSVQVLMNIQDDSKRGEYARMLAQQGYLIDVPIMVWNWDPLATMTVRKNQGFTWVPSALMPDIQVGPGLTFPGVPNYDPETIPAGAILVTTDFAEGLEHTNPWLYPGGENK